jgi:hypothetical protein
MSRSSLKISEHYINQDTLIEYYTLSFEIMVPEDITKEEWYILNHKLEDLYYEMKESKNNNNQKQK